MDLSTVQEILVIILAAALALFLLLAIAAAVLIIRLLRTLKQIVDRAEHVVESAEAVGEFFSKAAGPVGILRIIQALVDHKRKK
ncbi:MAG TPA: hypothetical protein VIR03_02065 [Candidatus Saccharimonadales bacterium]